MNKIELDCNYRLNTCSIFFKVRSICDAQTIDCLEFFSLLIHETLELLQLPHIFFSLTKTVIVCNEKKSSIICIFDDHKYFDKYTSSWFNLFVIDKIYYNKLLLILMTNVNRWYEQ